MAFHVRGLSSWLAVFILIGGCSDDAEPDESIGSADDAAGAAKKCGNGSCAGHETCASCPSDCGSCSDAGSGGTGSGGASGGSGGGATGGSAGSATGGSGGSAASPADAGASDAGGDSSATLPFAPAPPAPLRIVAVSTQSQLASALANALPGDEVQLTAGTYLGGVQLACGKGGTASHPIVVSGPRAAIVDRGGHSAGFGLRIRGPHWQLRGFTVQNAQFGVFAEACAGSPPPTDLVFDDLAVKNVGQNAYVLRNADRTYVQRGVVRDVGVGTNPYAEGVYIGHSSDTAQMSDDVRILGMSFGPGIRQEHIDIKGLSGGRSSGCLVQGNQFDATGTDFVALPASNGVIADQGAADCQYLDNVVTGIDAEGLSGFFLFTSVRPVLRNNRVAPEDNAISGAFGYRLLQPVVDPELYCSNVGTRNVGCIP